MDTVQNTAGSTDVICSLSHLYEWVEEQKSAASAKTAGDRCVFLYRGHSDKNYSLLPSVYRLREEGKSFRPVECYLYQEMLRHSPDAFFEDRTIFERLVRMQHHGLPTRLLDLTVSPLVALFFACMDHKESEANGEILLFTPSQQFIHYSSSLPEHSLVGLEKPVDFLGMLQGLYIDFCQATKDVFENRIGTIQELQHDDSVKDLYASYTRIIEICTVAKFGDCRNIPVLVAVIDQMEAEIDCFFDEWINKLENISSGSLEEEVKNLKILYSIYKTRGFYRDLKLEVVNKYCSYIGIEEKKESWNISFFIKNFSLSYFVLPPLNNERIRRQQGAFLLFPPFPLNSKQEALEEIRPAVRIAIPKEHKKKLYEELAAIGITKSYLFPELEKQAEEVMAIYPGQAPVAVYDAEPNEIAAQVARLNAP